MKSVSIYAALLLVLAISCQPTSSEPGLAPLAAFKAGLVAGILKSLKIQPSSSSQNRQSFRGTASGDLSFSGRLNRNGNQNSNNGYGQPYWNSGQLKLSGNVNYSGQRRPISSNGSGTRRQSLRGNVAFSGKIRPVQTVTNAPVVAFVRGPVETYAMTPPVAVTPAPTVVASIVNNRNYAPISSGFSAADVNVVRSNNGMPYGYRNVNINVANAGSGVGAVINLNGGRTHLSPSESGSTVEEVPSTFDDFSSFSSTSDDTFVSPDETFSDLPSDTYLTPSEDTFGNYDSFDSINEFDTTADNEILPETDIDFTATESDFGGTDIATNFEENIDSFIPTDFASESTTKAPDSVKIEFNASGSGFIRKGNGIRGSGNLAFDSLISTPGVTETPVRSTDFTDYGTFADYDSPDFSTDTASFASDYNTDFTSDNAGGVTSDISTDSTSDVYTDFTSDFNTDSTSEFSTDFTSDYNSDLTSDFNTDVTSDYSTDFIDTSVPEIREPLNTNNDFEINTSGYVSGTTDDDLEPSVAVSGTNTEFYNSYIQSNVDAIRALSDISKTHGNGRPVSIRLRTAHRVRKPAQSSSQIQGQGSSALSSTAGGGLLGIFSDGSRYQVSQAPLLYKYSDIIESPDAVPSRQWQLSASASGNANLNFVEGRSITGGRMRLETKRTTQGKSIPNSANPSNTIAENVQRAQLVPARNNRNPIRAQNRPPSSQTVRMPAKSPNVRRGPITPRRSTATNTRTRAPHRSSNTNTRMISNRPQAGAVTRNSNRNLDAKSIADSRRTQNAANSARNNSEFSFLGVLAQFAEAHRQSLLKTAASSQISRSPAVRTNSRQGSNQTPRIARHASINGNSGRAINTVAMQQLQGVPVSSAPNARSNYRGMLYEANPAATKRSPSIPTQIQNRLYALNPTEVNQNPSNPVNQNPSFVGQIQSGNSAQIPIAPSNLREVNVLPGRGNLGIPSFPSNPQKTPVSSLDRKENSGITRARLRYRHSEVIPPSQL